MDDWMRDLRRDYASRLGDRLAEIERLDGGLPATRDRLLHELHLLGGSAGSYGLPEISAAAQAWERALRAGAATAEARRRLVEAVSRAG